MTVKKVRARDPEWLKIKTDENEGENENENNLEANNRRQLIVSDEDIVEEGKVGELKPSEVNTIDDERKLRRIAAFKQRQNRQLAE